MSSWEPSAEYCAAGCKQADIQAQETESSKTNCNTDSEDLLAAFKACNYCVSAGGSPKEQAQLSDSTQQYIAHCESEWDINQLQSVSTVLSAYDYSVTFTGSIPSDRLTTSTGTDTRTAVDGITPPPVDATATTFNTRTSRSHGVYGIDVASFPTSTGNTEAESTSNPDTEEQPSIDNPGIAGISVACILAAIMLGAGAYIYIRSRQKRKRKAEAEAGSSGEDNDNNEDLVGFKAQLHGDSYDPKELPDSQRQACFEVESGTRFELPANEPPAPEMMGGSQSPREPENSS